MLPCVSLIFMNWKISNVFVIYIILFFFFLFFVQRIILLSYKYDCIINVYSWKYKHTHTLLLHYHFLFIWGRPCSYFIYLFFSEPNSVLWTIYLVTLCTLLYLILSHSFIFLFWIHTLMFFTSICSSFLSFSENILYCLNNTFKKKKTINRISFILHSINELKIYYLK